MCIYGINQQKLLGNNQLTWISWGELAITTFILNFLSSVIDERQVCAKNVFFEDKKKKCVYIYIYIHILHICIYINIYIYNLFYTKLD